MEQATATGPVTSEENTTGPAVPEETAAATSPDTSIVDINTDDAEADSPVLKTDEELIAEIESVQTIPELYLYQVPDRSQAVEDAINKRGTELVAASEPTDEADQVQIEEVTTNSVPSAVTFTGPDGVVHYSTRVP